MVVVARVQMRLLNIDRTLLAMLEDSQRRKQLLVPGSAGAARKKLNHRYSEQRRKLGHDNWAVTKQPPPCDRVDL